MVCLLYAVAAAQQLEQRAVLHCSKGLVCTAWNGFCKLAASLLVVRTRYLAGQLPTSRRNAF